jgi:hypothetical protein
MSTPTAADQPADALLELRDALKLILQNVQHSPHLCDVRRAREPQAGASGVECPLCKAIATASGFAWGLS